MLAVGMAFAGIVAVVAALAECGVVSGLMFLVNALRANYKDDSGPFEEVVNCDRCPPGERHFSVCIDRFSLL